MPGLSQEWEKALLQHIFKSAGPTGNEATGGFVASPAGLYVSLHSADPTDVASSAQANEISGDPGYARAQLDPDADIVTHTNWNAIDEPVDAQRITNKVDIAFPPATGNWNAGNPLTNFGLWAVAAVGTDEEYILHGPLPTPVTVLNGNTLIFQGGAPGNLSITVS